jgi:hypothetical protein
VAIFSPSEALPQKLEIFHFFFSAPKFQLIRSVGLGSKSAAKLRQ